LDIERHDFDLVSFSKIEFQHSIYQWFTYPNTEKAISKPLAPAYIFMGVGAENIDKEKKSILYIAFYIKNNFTLDQQLADQGAFGVLKLRMMQMESYEGEQ
jgi:hypothetical protein